MRKRWETIKELTPCNRRGNDRVIPALIINQTPVTSDSECAEKFNAFFSGTGSKISQELGYKYEAELEPLSGPGERKVLDQLGDIDELETERVISDLRGGSGPGWDGISVQLLKRFKTELGAPLTHLINTSFQTGVFPDPCKETVVTPVFKKGTKTEINNYRPISMLSNGSKIIEKVVKKQLVRFFEETGAILANQYGFRKGFCTEDALGDLTDTIYQSMDRGRIPGHI